MILQGKDQFTGPSFSIGNRALRMLWSIVYALGFRLSPRPFHAWRTFLLRLFGAKMGRGCHVYPSVRIWAPWNLEFGDHVGVGDRAILYAMDRVIAGDYVTISQGAHLCAGTHDYDSENFQLVTRPIRIGAHAWLCSEAFIHPGVTVPVGAVIGARAVVVRSPAEPWAVYAGNPCVQIGTRRRRDGLERA